MSLTNEMIRQAFSIMGAYLRDRKTVGEIAVYGGSAILLQFEWRTVTRDVDAVIVSTGNHGLVEEAAKVAAAQLGLLRSWLSEAVAQYTSSEAGAQGLRLSGFYPEDGVPGLRVLVATPQYLLAMKLIALERATATDRDFEDAKMLAREVGVTTVEELQEIYRSYFPGRSLPDRAASRLEELENAIRRST